MSERSVAEPEKLSFEDPVHALNVRIVNGTVNVVGTEEASARLEVSEIDGPPLIVTLKDGILTVAYEDLPWNGFLKRPDRRGRTAALSYRSRSRRPRTSDRRGAGRGGGLRHPGAHRGPRRHR